MDYNLITLLGPTAVGKTNLAAKLASKFKGEIISADSRQVFKGMDIGTGKDFDDYQINSKQIPYHLIDIVNPNEEFDLFQFTKEFNKAYDLIVNNGNIPFLVGGTGLYLHSVLKGYSFPKININSPRAKELKEKDAETLRGILINRTNKLHNTTDLLDKDRLVKAILVSESEGATEKPTMVNSLTLGIDLPRKIIKERITARLKERLENGMIDEVEQLLTNGVDHAKLRFFGLEYKYVSLYLERELNYNDMFQKLNSAIHNFAKRQMTWFRKMEREGIKIHWLDGADEIEALQIIKENFSLK